METPANLPLRLGSTEAFARAREFLVQAGFNDTAVCRAMGIETMSELAQVDWRKISLNDAPAPLRWCIEVFLRRAQVSERESSGICGEQTWAALQSLGILKSREHQAGAVQCPVWVYPADGFIIASDPTENSEGEPRKPAPDIVFPAIYGGTLQFLRLLPRMEGCDALDLCGGTGIGALHCSRFARSAVTSDITPRSAFFAEFNARLNGARIESCCGDLYATIGDRQFDIISAHPPFIPALENSLAYRDAGDTGEDVTRRVIAGLPAHLRPGGACVVLCVARDTREETFEQRARRWLGDSQEEFDIIFGREKVLPVEQVVDSLRLRNEAFGPDQGRLLRTRLASLATRQFVYGALVLRRYPQGQGLEPLRVHLAYDGGAEDFHRLFGWRQFRREAGFSQWLADAKPRLADKLELTQRFVVQDGELTHGEFVFSLEDGLASALRPDSFVVPLVARLNGTRSPREVVENARQAGELPDGFGLEPFLNLVERMIGLGLLEVEFRNR